MSLSSERGRSFEVRVQKLTKRILKLDVKRDKQSGAGTHRQDIRDRFNEIPLFIECKDQETIKPKEWWRIANAKASYGQAPIVVFPDNEEILCVIRYSDVLQIIKESDDYRKTLEENRISYTTDSKGKIFPDLNNVVIEKISTGTGTCGYGHIADETGHCLTKKCPYSRGYRKPKEKK